MSANMTQATAPMHAIQSVERIARPEQVSVAGVVLLSALAVALTILGVLTLGAVMVGAYWLISHVPVPPFVWHALASVRALL